MSTRMIVGIAMAATAMSCAAQQSMESKGGPVGPIAAAAPEATLEKASSAGVPRTTPSVPGASGLSAQENHFPYPIWRSAMIDDVNKLVGVLVRTAKGTVQIEKLLWGIDEEEGYVYACYLRGYNREGDLVSFGSPDGCESSVTKNEFLRALAATESGLALKSFDFGTDHEGYLFILDPVFEVRRMVGGRDHSCRINAHYYCVSNGCSGSCGFVVAEMAAGGRGFGTRPPFAVSSISCTCSGASGSCSVNQRRWCSGSCDEEGESCVMADTPHGATCGCE